MERSRRPRRPRVPSTRMSQHAPGFPLRRLPALAARPPRAIRPGRVGRGRGPGHALGLRRARRARAPSHPRLAVVLVRRGRHVLAPARVARPDAPRPAALGVHAAAVLPAGLGLGAAFGRDELGPAVALGRRRDRDRAARLPRGARARRASRRAHRGAAGRRQPDARLVLAGGAVLRPVRVLSTASLWLMARARSRPTAGRLVAWAVVAALALWTHYFALFVVAPEALLLLALRGVPLRRRLPGPVLVALLASPLPALALTQRTRKYWFLGLPLPRRVKRPATSSSSASARPRRRPRSRSPPPRSRSAWSCSPPGPTPPSGAGRSLPPSSAGARSPCPSGWRWPARTTSTAATSSARSSRSWSSSPRGSARGARASSGPRPRRRSSPCPSRSSTPRRRTASPSGRASGRSRRSSDRRTASGRSCSRAAGPGRARSASTCRGRGGCPGAGRR